MSKEHVKSLLALDSPYNETGIGLSVLTTEPGQMLVFDEQDAVETQLVVLSGSGSIVYSSPLGEAQVDVQRQGLLNDMPSAFSFPSGTQWATASSQNEPGLEIAIITTPNEQTFVPVMVKAEEVRDEERGAGTAGGTMHRKVRAVFGDPLAPTIIPESNLVMGEVVNFPGRWSSYPPHGHPHPEVYFYRFPEGGFGVSVLGDEAQPDAAAGRVVRDGDVEQILHGVGHAQVAAPGYPMWYLWIVRHLPDNRYEGNPPFSFFEAHQWVNEPDADIWSPKK